MNSQVTETSPQVRSYVGEWEILQSGVFHSVGGQPCRIEVDSLKFVFKFIDDDGESGWKAEIIDDEYVFFLTNHKNILTEGVFSPIEVATVRGKRLAITYQTNTVTAGRELARRLEYTLMMAAVR